MWIQLLTLELIDGASDVVSAVESAVSGVRRHRFLRRAPKLPWEEQQKEIAREQVVVSRPKRRRVKLPQVVEEAVAATVPVQTVQTLDAPKITIPSVGTATLRTKDYSDPEEESVIMALVQ